jgi:putative addiction module component (TIGR02574 family)
MRGMSSRAEKLFEEALSLPPEARAGLAAQLIESLDEEIDEGAEAEWAATIARRMSELRSGEVKGVPWSEARRRILGEAEDD